MSLAKCINVDDPEALANAVYPYCPSFGAAIFFAVLFGCSTIAHIVQAVIYKKKYCWVIAMATAWETVGFATRAASSQHIDAREPLATALATVTIVFVLIAPIWLNAFIYMTFGRMVLYFLPDQRVGKISARRLTLIFVLLDIIAFITQAIGAVVLASSNDSPSTFYSGLHIYMIGIGIQQLFILSFFALSILFRKRAVQWPLYRPEQSWHTLLYLLWFALLLISVRILYRLGQYTGGLNGYGATHEWLEYVWDGLPMLLAMAAFNVYHPARVLVGPDSEFQKISREEKKALKAAKKEAKKEAKEAGKAWKVKGFGGVKGVNVQGNTVELAASTESVV